jgi:hypothetical protein
LAKAYLDKSDEYLAKLPQDEGDLLEAETIRRRAETLLILYFVTQMYGDQINSDIIFQEHTDILRNILGEYSQELDRESVFTYLDGVLEKSTQHDDIMLLKRLLSRAKLLVLYDPKKRDSAEVRRISQKL